MSQFWILIPKEQEEKKCKIEDPSLFNWDNYYYTEYTVMCLIFEESKPWSQNVHMKGHPRAVSKAGLKLPSKNLSNKPLSHLSDETFFGSIGMTEDGLMKNDGLTNIIQEKKIGLMHFTKLLKISICDSNSVTNFHFWKQQKLDNLDE